MAAKKKQAVKKEYDPSTDPDRIASWKSFQETIDKVHKHHANVVSQLGKYGIKDIIMETDKDGKMVDKHIEIAPGIFKPRNPKKQEQWRQDKLKELPPDIANMYGIVMGQATHSTNVKTGVKTKYQNSPTVDYDVSKANDALDQHIVKHMTSNTGKVDQSALPKTSEKPVASKKKTEPTPTSAETKKPTAKKASERTAKPAEKPVDRTKTPSGRKFPDVDKKPADAKKPATKPSTAAKTTTAKKETEKPAEKKNDGKYMVTYDPTGTTKLDKAEYVSTPAEAKERAGKDKGRKERMAERKANPAQMPDANFKPQSEWPSSSSSLDKTDDPEFHDWSDEDAGISPSSSSSSSTSTSSSTAEPAKEKKPGLWSRIKKSVAGSEAKYEPAPVVDDDGGRPKDSGEPKSEPKSEPVSEDGTGEWEPETKPAGGRGGHFAAGHGAPTFGSQRNLGSTSGGGRATTRDDARNIQANQSYGSNITNGAVTGATIGINNNSFGSGSGPVVASTEGKASSENPEATVLSTGGDAKQTHPRAQNASRGGRQTTKNSVRTKKP